MSITHHRLRGLHGIRFRENTAGSSLAPVYHPRAATERNHARRFPQRAGRASDSGNTKLWTFLGITAALVCGGGASADPMTYNMGCNGTDGGGACVVSPWTADIGDTDVLRRGFPFAHYARDLWWWERKKLETAMRQFPDAVSCLDDGALGTDGHDLTAVAWSALNSDEMIEVCLTRIHNAIGNPENSVKWFEEIGYSAKLLTWRDRGNGEKRVNMDANWQSQNQDPPWRLSFWREGSRAFQGFSITVTVNQNGHVKSVFVKRTYE